MFRRKKKEEIVLDEATAALIRKMRMDMMKTLISLCLVMVVGTLACVSYFSAAWFANNKRVDAMNSSVNTETPTPSLFIAKGDTVDEKYYTATGNRAAAGLYPISTVDCKDWYYVTDWEMVKDTDGISLKPMASKYAKVSATAPDDNMAVSYTTAEDKTHVAYYKQAFTLYTDYKEMDVYLNPENPIQLTYAEDADSDAIARVNAVKSGLRIAITDASGNLLLYYAPAAEAGTGNSKNAQADTYQGISGTEAANIAAIANVFTPESIGGITAAQVAGSEPAEYTAQANSKNFGTADETGLVLNTYIWLEGTDAQTLKHITAGVTDPLDVTFSFVGVEKS